MKDGVEQVVDETKGHASEAIGLTPISTAEFNDIRSLVYNQFGINLSEEKKTLLVGRLQKVLKSRGMQSFRQYYTYLQTDQTGQALSELAACISTNHTFFYREKDHFEFFSGTALPEIVARKKARDDRDLRVWCAGCASGEEPYTLVMLLLEYFGTEYSKWQAGLLATDISANALCLARAAIYPQERVDLLPSHLKSKYLKKNPGGAWSVIDRVKSEVTFRGFNLMNSNFPFKRPFDIIFCRNVMIYFDRPTRDALVRRFYECTSPGGYLFIGHSETLGRGESPYSYIMPAVYKKRGVDECN